MGGLPQRGLVRFQCQPGSRAGGWLQFGWKVLVPSLKMPFVLESHRMGRFSHRRRDPRDVLGDTEVTTKPNAVPQASGVGVCLVTQTNYLFTLRVALKSLKRLCLDSGCPSAVRMRWLCDLGPCGVGVRVSTKGDGVSRDRKGIEG